MKTIIMLFVFSAGLMFAQTDSSQIKRENQEKNQIKKQEQEKTQLQKQIGPKENLQAEMKQNRKKKDVFIDKDGDGICDTRQSGMSFNKMRKRMGSGQKGPGRVGGSENGYGGGH
jgi:hypothetical protein